MRTASTKYGAADAPKTSIPRTIAVIGVLIAAAKTHTNPIAAKNVGSNPQTHPNQLPNDAPISNIGVTSPP
mgnify:FL=1